MMSENYSYIISVETKIGQKGNYIHKVSKKEGGKFPLIINNELDNIKKYHENLLKRGKGRTLLHTSLEVMTLSMD